MNRNPAHQAIARRCLPRRRFAQLHLAERAAHTAGPDVRPRLCMACGGFHLTTTGTPSGDLR